MPKSNPKEKPKPFIDNGCIAHLHNTTFMGTELLITDPKTKVKQHFRIHEHTPQGYRLQNLSNNKESFVPLEKLLTFVGKNEF